MKYVNTITGAPPYASDYMLSRMRETERKLYAPVIPTRPPWYDGTTHRLAADYVEFDGKDWVQRWSIEPLDKEETEARAAEETEARKAQARGMLAESDYRATSDRWAAMEPEQQKAWAAYREALRDVVRGVRLDLPIEP